MIDSQTSYETFTVIHGHHAVAAQTPLPQGDRHALPHVPSRGSWPFVQMPGYLRIVGHRQQGFMIAGGERP
jgi:hypothetical protein